ncbi:phage antirepressor [Dolosigranulum pigrum]|uniref:phage antirepressor n=1 Tax=Dolosigranulum pigrum TaxID=29394 RepID=UPI001AD874B0|nr:phage antirepressor [Dolosigranulum pigrum]QTJ50514.1 phage antirepressor [Dolosigranulum pigrum]
MDLQEFNFKGQEVRTVMRNNTPYFIGKDVAEALGYRRPTKAIADHIDDEDKDEVPIQDSIGRSQMTPIINESGLYSLILKSNLDTAKRFKRWVTSEVLPSIRKRGLYATDELLNNPDLLIQVATELKNEREQRLIAEQRINELQPKATYYDLVLQNKSLISVSKIAKDYGKSAQWLNSKLHELGVQYKQGGTWLLYQKYADKGYTQSTTHVIDEERNKLFTKWTQKGRLFIYELLKNQDVLPLIEQAG